MYNVGLTPNILTPNIFFVNVFILDSEWNSNNDEDDLIVDKSINFKILNKLK